MTLDGFLDDEKTIDAASKCAEAVGTAASEILKIAPDYDDRHPGLNLKGAYGSRNRLAHGYYVVDANILWTTCKASIPNTVAVAIRIRDRRQR